MNDTDRRILRNRLLLVLSDASRNGLPLSTLHDYVRVAGYELSDDELLRELDYLIGKALAQEKVSALSAGHKRYSITSDGIDYLEGEGLK